MTLKPVNGALRNNTTAVVLLNLLTVEAPEMFWTIRRHLKKSLHIQAEAGVTKILAWMGANTTSSFMGNTIVKKLGFMDRV